LSLALLLSSFSEDHPCSSCSRRKIAVGAEFANGSADLAMAGAWSAGQNGKLIELTSDQWQFLCGDNPVGAARAGAADALRVELAESQPQFLSRLARAIPDLYPKAYRWAPEMEQIADFLGDDLAARDIFMGMAALCRRLAADQAGELSEIGLLDAFVAKLAK
jgi:Domain of unknown function (DUF1932)